MRTFKALNEAKYTAETSNFLKSHHVLKQPEATYSFKPAINNVSRQLDSRHMEQYMSEALSRNEEDIPEPASEADANVGLHRSASGDGRSKFSAAETDINARIMRMYDKEKQRNEWIKAERTKKRCQELKGCTFRPQLESHFDLERKRPVHQARPKVRQDEYKSKEEKDLEQCTFRPQINRRHASFHYRDLGRTRAETCGRPTATRRS